MWTMRRDFNSLCPPGSRRRVRLAVTGMVAGLLLDCCVAQPLVTMLEDGRKIAGVGTECTEVPNRGRKILRRNQY